MSRDGPGFLFDLFVVFGTYAVIMVGGDIVVSELGLRGNTATAVVLVIGAVVIFSVLVVYYRVFLTKDDHK